ncbi:MAG: stage II sporulation protein M [Bacteroidetes bacterium]|nr:stage II sporulation protein M [Bacteroidota bacterium]
MKESKFIEQNKQKWIDFEKENHANQHNPRILSRFFIQITEDLSYARTFYRYRLIRVYLNDAAQKIFYGIYKNEKSSLRNFFRFWREELPLTFYKVRRAFLISFLVFVLSFLIGMLSSANDPDFCHLILGKEYINKTIENINKGDPMGIYKKEAAFNMYLSITLNNLLVSFRTFVLGVFVALGSIFLMIYNGIMVGSFQYFFIERGLFWESFLTIWQHGTLEISSIIIAGAAGITLGKGILFPGTLTRYESFKLSAKQGLKVMAGITPIIIMAAFIESFYTRYTEAPAWIRIMVILVSLAFILIYFVWFPRRQARNPAIQQKIKETLSANKIDSVKKEILYSHQELVSNTFKFLRQFSSKYVKFIIISSIIYAVIFCGYFYIFYSENIESTYFLFNNIYQLFNYQTYPVLFLLNVLIFLQFLLFNTMLVRDSIENDHQKSAASFKKILLSKTFFNHLVIIILINLPFFIEEFWGLLIMLIVLPFLLFWMFASSKEGFNLFKGISYSFSVLKPSLSKLLGLYLKLLLFSFVVILLMSLKQFWFFMEIIIWNVNLQSDFNILLNLFIRIFIFSFVLIFCISMIYTGISLLFYSIKEASTAIFLKERIQKIGTKKRIFGYEIESN